jgi:spore maturation protein CgeB
MKTLAEFRNLHQGSTIVVCGCGESLNELTEPAQFFTIGVNDVGRRFDPDYLVVVNPRNQFSGDRFNYVESSKASYLFTQLDLGLSHENVVRFDLGTHGGTDLSDPNVLHYTQNSPYVALCLAVHMGARRIGVIGVDFTDHHFFAPTGRHALEPQLALIDKQYTRLYEAISALGVEVFNLSSTSRLTAFPKMSLTDFSVSAAATPQHVASKRLFFINYRFLSCGEVFTDGLRNAARSLGLAFQDAYWDDEQLPAKVQQFSPDWLFVVHGRRFVERWRGSFPGVKKAVWLLDEPYEVDDTSSWSNEFDAVYLNDPSTIHRHRNAHYLPVAYDPHVHHENGHSRNYQVGFIGGHNNARERYLLALQEAGLLSYVVGGPWRSSALRSLCLSPNIPASATADLYRQTRIVVNLFREVHHFNERGVQPFSMNPRVYEALACGAVVVSETRSELATVFPDVPLFSNDVELVHTVNNLVQSDEAYSAVKKACREKLAAHSYRERLLHVLATLDSPAAASVKPKPRQEATMTSVHTSSLSLSGWTACGDVVESARDNDFVLYKAVDDGPGTERGLASDRAYRDVELEFDLKLAADTCFIAKLRQAGQLDQKTNSYHLFCHPRHTYFARHHHVLQNVQLKREQWQHIKLRCYGNELRLEVDGQVVARIVDEHLKKGYCFVGVKSGRAWLRNLNLRELAAGDPVVQQVDDAAIRNSIPGYTVLHTTAVNEPPLVSIITTVYDRVSLLAACLRSVRELQFRDFEHIIVSDHPPAPVVDGILTLVRTAATDGATYANLSERANNWGIAPASAGLHLARGRYVCFLSDDNGYTPDHFEPLVNVLNENDDIAFAYSSCQYAGRLILRNSTPLPGGIDLGQPLFRKEIFDRYLPGKLPFDMMAWDWHMIETFMRHGLKWRHVDRASFLFRLAACSGRA